MRSLGILGGSFNPVHLAHLVVAERVRESLGLEHVLFVPAGRQPLKGATALAPAADRLEMLRLALAGNPNFEASPIELERSGPSYTIDTLETLRRREPGAELWLILGADAFLLADRWREFEQVRRLARIVVVPRAGEETPNVEGAGGEPPVVVHIPALEISGSDIRARVARGASIRYLVPEAVRAYILERGLYRA